MLVEYNSRCLNLDPCICRGNVDDEIFILCADCEGHPEDTLCFGGRPLNGGGSPGRDGGAAEPDAAAANAEPHPGGVRGPKHHTQGVFRGELEAGSRRSAQEEEHLGPGGVRDGVELQDEALRRLGRAAVRLTVDELHLKGGTELQGELHLKGGGTELLQGAGAVVVIAGYDLWVYLVLFRLLFGCVLLWSWS